MKQNLVWASVCNILAISVALGVLFPAYGVMLRSEWSALLMSLSSIIVAVNAVLLKRVEDDLGEPGQTQSYRLAAPHRPNRYSALVAVECFLDAVGDGCDRSSGGRASLVLPFRFGQP